MLKHSNAHFPSLCDNSIAVQFLNLWLWAQIIHVGIFYVSLLFVLQQQTSVWNTLYFTVLRNNCFRHSFVFECVTIKSKMSIKGKKKCWYILLTRYCNLHVSDLAFVSCLVCTNGRALELPVFQARSQVGDSHWQGLLVTEEKLWYILLFSHNQAEGIH